MVRDLEFDATVTMWLFQHLGLFMWGFVYKAVGGTQVVLSEDPAQIKEGHETMRWKRWRTGAILPATALLAAALAAVPVSAAANPGSMRAATTGAGNPLPNGLCANPDHSSECLDVSDAYGSVGYDGAYVGHDEPSLLFYSDQSGSGNNNTYLLRLPKDPPIAPRQDGTGGTANFQLHPAFWFGMAMCDSESFPLFTTNCQADTDANIFNSPDPASPRFIGKHPGTAFLEMQFYPPGWTLRPRGGSCDALQWCAALTIDSLSQTPAGTLNNPACQAAVGTEYVNFAFITKNGTAQGPANPLDATLATVTPDPQQTLFMQSGDLLSTRIFDTPAGVRVDIKDLSAGTSGSMTAGIANGFAQVNFQPTAASCSVTPYAFHPMYATSSPNTRVPWAAHSYNIAFSDEIGHFEYCNAIDPATRQCTSAGVTEANGTLDNDDVACRPAGLSSHFQITGCRATDDDFDGPEYGNNWPGTGSIGHQVRFDAQPIALSSPLFDGFKRFSQAAFETDLPRIEEADIGGPGPFCDPNTGANCVNPPPGAQFYPIFTTVGHGPFCLWRLGGPNLPAVSRTFGGSSATEYGNLVQLFYPAVDSSGNPTTSFKFEDFRQILPDNPC